MGCLSRFARTLALALALLAGTASMAHSQIVVSGGGFGYGYPGYGYGAQGYGYGYPGYGMGYGGTGYGMGYGYGSPYGYGYGAAGYGYGASGFGYGSPYGYGYGYNNFAAVGYPSYVAGPLYGYVPPGYSAGYVNPLFGLGLSPLGVQSALGERSLRGGGLGVGVPAYSRGYGPVGPSYVPGGPGLGGVRPR